MKYAVSLLVSLAVAVAACGATSSRNEPAPPPPPEGTALVPLGYRAAILRTGLNVRIREYEESELERALADTDVDLLAYFGDTPPRDFLPLGDWLVDALVIAARNDLGPDTDVDSTSLSAYAADVVIDDDTPRLAMNSDMETRAAAGENAVFAALAARTRRVESASPLRAILNGEAEFAILDAGDRAALAVSTQRMADRITLVPLPARRVLRLAARKTNSSGARLVGRLREATARMRDGAYEPVP